MVVELIYGSVLAQQNTKIHLGNSIFYRSTKIVKSCRGKWYYEGTHYAGGSNLHLFGFDTNLGYINFYPDKHINAPQFYMAQSFSHIGSSYSSIPFPVEDEHTVGVGIDVDEHRFYVFYNNNYAYYDFIMPGKCRNLNVRVVGAYTSDTNDNVSINFGDKPFKYKISGFTPWSKMPERITCYYRRKVASVNVFLCYLIIVF